MFCFRMSYLILILQAFAYNNTGIRQRGNGCFWAKYLDENTIVSNVIDCNFAKLNNLCMKEAKICPAAKAAHLSASVQSSTINERKKRSIECSDENSINSECDATNSVTNIDPENPLELIFNPAKSGDREELMKEAKKEYQDNFSGMDIKSSYDALFEILWYTQVPCFDVGNVTSVRQFEYGMIKSCMWKGIKLPCSNIFTASPTDRGMCCSFNVQAAEKMFKSGDYQNMIQKMQERDRSLAFDLNESWSKPARETQNFKPEAGVAKGLTLVLDSHSDVLSGSSISDDFQGFLAVVNDNKQFPITTQKSVLIRPGHYNLVSIHATKVSARRDIEKYEPAKRLCYFNEESSLNAHKNYSQSNCKLECQVNQVLIALKAKNHSVCSPWFFPTIKAEYPMCDPWEAQEFQNQMRIIGDAECNHCYPDCDTTEIQATASAAPFTRCDFKNVDISPLCTIDTASISDPPKWGHVVLEEYKAKGDIPSYVMDIVKTNKRKYIMEGDKRKEGQRGKELFPATNNQDMSYDAYEKDIATVTFFFESSNSFEFLRQSKTTMINYISQVGGLLGLCLGFSLISAIEIIYWFTLKLFRSMISDSIK